MSNYESNVIFYFECSSSDAKKKLNFMNSGNKDHDYCIKKTENNYNKIDVLSSQDVTLIQ